MPRPRLAAAPHRRRRRQCGAPPVGALAANGQRGRRRAGPLAGASSPQAVRGEPASRRASHGPRWWPATPRRRRTSRPRPTRRPIGAAGPGRRPAPPARTSPSTPASSLRAAAVAATSVPAHPAWPPRERSPRAPTAGPRTARRGRGAPRRCPAPAPRRRPRSQFVRRSMGSTRCIRTSGRAIARARPGRPAPEPTSITSASTGRAGWTTAQLSTCRSQSRGTSRGPTSPWETPLSARMPANRFGERHPVPEHLGGHGRRRRRCRRAVVCSVVGHPRSGAPRIDRAGSAALDDQRVTAASIVGMSGGTRSRST